MKNKLLNIGVMILLAIIILTVSVSAVSFTATMSASSNTVQESTEFTITVKVSNLDVGTNGINSLEGYLKYDTDIFETISESSIEGLNSWSANYDESTGKISMTKSTFVTSTQEVFQITFKTKSGVSGESGTISYSDIVASNSETTISATDISTSITIGDSSSDTNTTNTTNTITINTLTTVNNTTNNTANNATTNNTTNSTTNNAVVSSYVSNTLLTNTSSETDMPDTGVDDTVLELIFVAIVIAFVFYIKIEKLNKDIK